jgi:hypothetical protein
MVRSIEEKKLFANLWGNVMWPMLQLCVAGLSLSKTMCLGAKANNQRCDPFLKQVQDKLSSG